MSYERVWSEALKAGEAAAEACTPALMVVGNPRTGETWEVEGGCCGFAWVKVAGNTAFGRWAKANAGFRKAYPTGLSFWVSTYGQSLERKTAFAMAAAEYLREKGITAYGESRID